MNKTRFVQLFPAANATSEKSRTISSHSEALVVVPITSAVPTTPGHGTSFSNLAVSFNPALGDQILSLNFPSLDMSKTSV